VIDDGLKHHYLGVEKKCFSLFEMFIIKNADFLGEFNGCSPISHLPWAQISVVIRLEFFG
jgi:hypothetical protein